MPIHPPHIHGPIVAHACARQPAATEARARSRRGACRVARHLPTAAHVSVPAPSDAAERAASRRRTARASSGIPVRQHGFGTFGEGRRRAVARRPRTYHAPPFSTRPIVARGHPRQGRVRGCGGHRRPRGSGPPAESNRGAPRCSAYMTTPHGPPLCSALGGAWRVKAACRRDGVSARRTPGSTPMRRKHEATPPSSNGCSSSRHRDDRRCPTSRTSGTRR